MSLVDLVEHYEEKEVPMGFPSPLAALEFRMDQAGLLPRDLVPLIGSRAKVSEVLSGKKALTLRMARALHEHLGIPAEVLLQQQGGPDGPELEWSQFPLQEMVKPRLAKEFLARHGIPLVIASHLKRTYLDGAALMLGDGTPVIALTLRHDRLDNFWFCLLHELAHAGRHLESGEDTSFIDDLSLRGSNLGKGDRKEAEADEWAEEALIPKAVWETSAVRSRPTPMAVVQFANTLRIHPAIVAGRVRFERKNFRMLSHFVGTGEVRKHFTLKA